MQTATLIVYLYEHIYMHSCTRTHAHTHRSKLLVIQLVLAIHFYATTSAKHFHHLQSAHQRLDFGHGRHQRGLERPERGHTLHLWRTGMNAMKGTSKRLQHGWSSAKTFVFVLFFFAVVFLFCCLFCLYISLSSVVTSLGSNSHSGTRPPPHFPT